VKKPSLNPAAIGGFFLHHGEKLVFSALALFALLMTWRGIDAVRSESVDKNRTPDFVRDLANKAAANIDAIAKVPADRVPAIPPLAPRLDPWRPQQIKVVDSPAVPIVLNRPLYAELTKRTKPEVFPIADLQAVAGIAVLPDPVAEAAATMPGRRLADPKPPPESEDTRSQGRQNRRNPPPRTGGEGIFGGGEPAGPADLTRPDVEPLKPGRITPYIVVTGLIPAGKQQAEFNSRFSAVSFRDPRRDTPRWGDYIVERTRVTPGANPKWERLKIANVLRTPNEGVGLAGEGVGPNVRPPPGGRIQRGAAGESLAPERLPPGFFLQPEEAEVGYAAGLPARIDEPWSTDAVHPGVLAQLKKLIAGDALQGDVPSAARDATLAELKSKPLDFVGKEVRLSAVSLDAAPVAQRDVGLYRFGIRSADGAEAVDIQMIGANDTLVFATSQEWGGRLSFDVGDQSRACNLLVRVDMVGKTPVARILELQLLDDAGEVSTSRTEPNPAPVQLTDASGASANVTRAADGIGLVEKLAANRLFRFIDTNVEPGAEYRYRVRFVLRNPNAGLAPQHVVDTELARSEFLVSDYSNETSPVRVPDPTRVLARTIPRDAVRRLKLRGDAIELLVLTNSEENGNFSLRSVLTPIGGLANVDPTLNKPGNTRCFGEAATTDRILVDARGLQEERSDNRSPVPPEPLDMLMLRPDGEFEYVTAADSEPIVQRYRNTLFSPGDDLPKDGKKDSSEREAAGRGPL
jgi:hypothetical protein